jgi:hypothetical protein
LPYIEAKTAAQIFVQKFAFSNHALLIRLYKLMEGKDDLVQLTMSHVDEDTVSEMRKLFDDEECKDQNYRAWEVLCHFFRPKEKKALYLLLHGKINEHVVDLLGRRPSSAVHHTTEHSLHTTRLQNPYILSS